MVSLMARDYHRFQTDEELEALAPLVSTVRCPAHHLVCIVSGSPSTCSRRRSRSFIGWVFKNTSPNYCMSYCQCKGRKGHIKHLH